MNYFSFHIGDYAAHTSRLSLMEDLAYRRMLDAYYLAERPFNGSSADVAREIGMMEHIQAVEYVLNKFFTRTETGYMNARCEQEIAKFHDKKTKASNAGKASVERRLGKKSTDVEKVLTDVQLTKNQEPRTNNQEPINTNTKPRKSALCVAKPDEVDLKVWEDYLQVRKTKRTPITLTALDGIKRETQLAGMTLDEGLRMCCERGWVGFKANWLENTPPKRTVQAESFAERDARTRANRMAEFAPNVAARNASVFTTFDLEADHVAIACH